MKAITYLQNDDGSVSCVYGSNEADLRFVYSSLAIFSILKSDKGILNLGKMEAYLLKC